MSARIRLGTDKEIGGVCSGIARHYDADVTAIRILWAVLTVFTAVIPGVLIYLVCWAVFRRAER